MSTFAKEIEEELKQKLIPFWENLRDEENGGYYGYMGYDLKVQKDYEKGCILNSRILWFFANAYMTLGEEKLKEDADHAYTFLKEKCLDREYGGMFWSVTYDGKQLSIHIIRLLQSMLFLPIMMPPVMKKPWRSPEDFRR